MKSIFLKEVHAFFSSITGYVVISIFLILMGMFVWVFSDTSILENHYATLDPLFSLAPAILIFLVPAVTMKSFTEEFQTGTIEILGTKPILSRDIVIAKYLANCVIVLMAIIPTGIYYWSVYLLGSPPGNLDSGGIAGSYIGLMLLAMTFVSIGLFASLLSTNQVVAFLIGASLCFLIHWSFDFVSQLPVFYGKIDDIVEELGMNYHYASLSKGYIDSADILYFISIIVIFLILSVQILKWKKS